MRLGCFGMVVSGEWCPEPRQTFMSVGFAGRTLMLLFCSSPSDWLLAAWVLYHMLCAPGCCCVWLWTRILIHHILNS